MVSAPKLITQVALMGGRIVFNAFRDAYKAAAANAAKNVEAQQSQDANTRLTGMSVSEAKLILNLDDGPVTKEDILKVFHFLIQKYEQLFDMNDPAQGGSFYLQSKVFRAKERLELELGKTKETPSPPNV